MGWHHAPGPRWLAHAEASATEQAAAAKTHRVRTAGRLGIAVHDVGRVGRCPTRSAPRLLCRTSEVIIIPPVGDPARRPASEQSVRRRPGKKKGETSPSGETSLYGANTTRR